MKKTLEQALVEYLAAGPRQVLEKALDSDFFHEAERSQVWLNFLLASRIQLVQRLIESAQEKDAPAAARHVEDAIAVAFLVGYRVRELKGQEQPTVQWRGE